MQKITHVTTLLAVMAVLSAPMAQGQSVATPTYTSDTHEYLLDKWPAQMGQFSDGYVLVRTHNDDVSQFMIFDDKPNGWFRLPKPVPSSAMALHPSTSRGRWVAITWHGSIFTAR